ncbi:MAG: glycosyltransferase family 2 protein [Isosphaeraceae bacterium]
MSETPLLTVAIPTYQGASHLPETLRSILSQKGVAFDLLVCDDQSTDSTVETVETIAGRAARVEVNSQRLGLAGNWNRCVERSATPLVAIVHQDDVLSPGHLAAHVETFRSDPALGMVASASVVIDAQGRPVSESIVDRGGLGRLDLRFAPGEAVKDLAASNPLRCSAVTIRAEAHAALGGFDPTYRYVVDWEFWLRLSATWSVAWLGTPTVAVRWHPASETHTFKTGTVDLEETERVLNATARALTNLDLLQVASPRLARAYLNRAHQGLKAGDGALARRCLARAITLSPRILGTVLADPRLATQMAAVWAVPGLAARWFRRGP